MPPNESSPQYPTASQRKIMWTALSALFGVLLVGIVASGVWLLGRLLGFLQPILIPVAIAVILAYLLDPVITHLSRRRMSRAKAIWLLFAVAGLALVALLGWLVPTVSLQAGAFVRELPVYTVKARDSTVDLIFRYNQFFHTTFAGSSRNAVATSLVDWLLPAASPSPRPKAKPAAQDSAAASDFIGPPQPRISNAERERIQVWVEQQLPNLQDQLPLVTAKVWALVRTSIGGFLGVTGFLFSFIMVPIYLFFLLKERPAIEEHWTEYLPLRASPFKSEVATVLRQINRYIVAYFRGQLLVCLVDGTLIGITLMLLGLNFAPLIGLLVVLLTMIPYIGIVICWVPAVLIAAAQWGDWTHPLLITVVFFGVQNLEAIFVAPRIVGNSVGLHPMTVIVSIFVWGLLIGGLLGPILAVPLTATIKVLLARYVWGPRLREQVEEILEEAPELEPAKSEALA